MTKILFAIQNESEQQLLRDVLREQHLEMSVIAPDTIGEIDELVTSGEVDIIVTDFAFQNGGFADWLFLWQHPYVILADWEDYERLTSVTTDQTSDFVIRDPDCRHIRYLPLVIRKVLNNKESMERHNLDLRMNEQRYRELVQALPDIVYSLDEDGRLSFINDSVQALGWDPVEMIGKHFSILLDDEDVTRVSRLHVLPEFRGRETGISEAPKLFDERRTGNRRTTGLEVRLRHKDDTSHAVAMLYGSVIAYGEVNAVGFSTSGDSLGSPGTVGIIRDITERVEADHLLRQSLREKEILLSEIHHRVKNNMQVISSLLNLHTGGLVDREALRRFTDAEMQIQSMALIHEHLYQSEHFDEVEIGDYIHRLVHHLFEVYNVDGNRIEVAYSVETIPITIRQAVPVALLLNELISNSLKYAFPDDASGKIAVGVRRDENNYVHLDVSDDGVGLEPHFDCAAAETLGHTLISGLTSQLEGTLEVQGEGGASFSVVFPLDVIERSATAGSQSAPPEKGPPPE
ncbi:MAG: PAS domain S-box protein [Spirochaetaceae bacterium]|nr:MAG: PAS domain S-box protein [Spirochaetaceae bacterium]